MTENADELRVILVAPSGRDGELISGLLEQYNISCLVFPTSQQARIGMGAGAGVVIIAEEALPQSEIDLWVEEVHAQPSWSDLFFIILTISGERSQKRMLAHQPLGKMELLERPVRPDTFMGTVLAALRSRRRQYEMRDQLVAVRLSDDALRKSEKLAVAGRLALSISHEINNPLEAVTNLLYLIKLSPSLPDVKAFAETAALELARVSEIVTQTLRFYRSPNKPTVVHIGEIVDSALTLYNSRIASAEIIVERDFRDCSPIIANSGEIRQVTLNLIGNAVDAIGRRGRLRIRAANARRHSNGSLRGVRLTIGDTGSGINPQVRDSLFEPFVTTKGATGSGLGLWLSSQIVRKHGGTIQVKSCVLPSRSGTTFSIFIPLEFQSDAHADPRNGSVDTTQAPQA
jgi:signal transduction histidine kinase